MLLFATTIPQVTNMLTDLHDLAKSYGLELHPDKTYILTNLSQRRGRQATTTVHIGDRPVKVLRHDETTKYLGRLLGFSDYHAAELSSRISIAWRKFHALREELTTNRYALHSCLHLFDMTVTATVLYGCASWTAKKRNDHDAPANPTTHATNHRQNDATSYYNIQP